MPALQTDDIIDFSNSTLDEKIDVVFELLDRQRDLAHFTCENANISSDARTFLLFIIVICNTNFAVVLVNSLENRLYSYAEFLLLYSRKLDEYIEEKIEVDFLVVE